MSRRLKRTLFGIGTAALFAATAMIPRVASAAPSPACQQPSQYKCLAIDNYLYQGGEEEEVPIHSIRVRQWINDGSSGSTPFVSECENVSPGRRAYLSDGSYFLRDVSPNSTIFIQGWSGRDCNGGDDVANWVSGHLTVPDDDLRYFWIQLNR
jgi:hypothetical protein